MEHVLFCMQMVIFELQYQPDNIKVLLDDGTEVLATKLSTVKSDVPKLATKSITCNSWPEPFIDTDFTLGLEASAESFSSLYMLILKIFNAFSTESTCEKKLGCLNFY